MTRWLVVVCLLGMLALCLGLGQAPHGISSEEVPSGVLDGANSTFTLSFQPLPWSSLHLYRNGLRLKRGLDYVLSGQNHNQVVFCNPCADGSSGIPLPGDVIVADYTY